MNKEEQKPIPPYLPYRTLTNFLDGLKKGIPARIDRSVMMSLSGTAQSSLLATLQFLRLITESGVPTKDLQLLVKATVDDRKVELGRILRNAYTFVFADNLDLASATPNMISERFAKQGVSGGTIQKCVAFFTAMAKDAGMEMSHHVAARRSGPRSARPRRSRSEQGNGGDLDEPTPQGSVEFKLPIPGKQDSIVRLPDDIDRDDWEMLKAQLDAYVMRLIKQQG